MDFVAIIENIFRGLIGESFIAFGLAAMGLNLHFGYTGLLNFGQAAFMAAGAYGLAMTVGTLGPMWSALPGGFWFGCFMGIVVFPVLLAGLLGIPTLRLRADYLAIVTIAAAEMVRYIVRSPTFDDYTGGSDGIKEFADEFYELSPFQPSGRYFFDLFIGNQMFVVLFGWVMLAVAALLTWLLIRSPWGRVLKAIREDEDAAVALGKNAFAYKMQALVLGGVFGATGGMIRAIATQSAQPDNFVPDMTFFAWTALILGGAGKVLGPVVGSAILWAIINATDIVLRQAVRAGHMPEWLMEGTQVGQVRFMLIGAGLIVLAAFRPQGIFGNKEEMALDDR